MYPLLNGIRVLDLCKLVPGDDATRLLGDLGADVIKVEEPTVGDWLRDLPDVYQALNRNKRSITLNLKTDEGRDVFYALLDTAQVVVEVPETAADLDETLGVQAGTYVGVAAVTTAVGESLDKRAPVHVFVNPEVTDGLRRAGAQVVMSHELVHLATNAVRSNMEPWLLEGFADYVALRDVALPDRVTLGRAIDWVRRNGVPEALPTAADFDTRSEDLQAQYEMAWLACRIISERLGESGLVEAYTAARHGVASSEGLERLGPPIRELTATWRERLQLVAA